MAALSLSASASGACPRRSPNKGVVTFGEDVIAPPAHALSSTFYEGDDCETPVRQNSITRHNEHHVGFSLDLPDDNLDVNENANGGSGGSGGKKFLTAKYKKQRMGLVRRRIEVEDWIDFELKKIFGLPADSSDSYEGELDLDEMIDLPSDDDRTTYVKDHLSNMTTSATDKKVDAFIQELLVKIANL